MKKINIFLLSAFFLTTIGAVEGMKKRNVRFSPKDEVKGTKPYTEPLTLSRDVAGQAEDTAILKGQLNNSHNCHIFIKNLLNTDQDLRRNGEFERLSQKFGTISLEAINNLNNALSNIVQKKHSISNLPEQDKKNAAAIKLALDRRKKEIDEIFHTMCNSSHFKLLLRINDLISLKRKKRKEPSEEDKKCQLDAINQIIGEYRSRDILNVIDRAVHSGSKQEIVDALALISQAKSKTHS